MYILTGAASRRRASRSLPELPPRSSANGGSSATPWQHRTFSGLMNQLQTMYFFIAATRPMLGACRACAHERMRVPMRIDVRDRGVKSTEALRNYGGLRLMSVLDHLVRRVDGVTVCLADVHAPEGGINKRCRMLALLPSGEVCVEETHPGLYAAIDPPPGGVGQGAGPG